MPHLKRREFLRQAAWTTGTWCRDTEHHIACFSLPKGASKFHLA